MAKLITFFDLETTGLLKPEHKIIECSMRVCDLDEQKELVEKLWRFDPKRNIDAKAFAVHKIGLDELKGKPLIKEVMPQIINILKSSAVVVSHNGDSFDVPFLKQECEQAGFDFPEFYHFDTMVHGHFASELGKSPSLKELAWAMDVDYDTEAAHKGDYDTAVMRDAFFNALNKKWYNLGI